MRFICLQGKVLEDSAGGEEEEEEEEEALHKDVDAHGSVCFCYAWNM